jgi:hypothetical protein
MNTGAPPEFRDWSDSFSSRLEINSFSRRPQLSISKSRHFNETHRTKKNSSDFSGESSASLRPAAAGETHALQLSALRRNPLPPIAPLTLTVPSIVMPPCDNRARARAGVLQADDSDAMKFRRPFAVRNALTLMRSAGNCACRRNAGKWHSLPGCEGKPQAGCLCHDWRKNFCATAEAGV